MINYILNMVLQITMVVGLLVIVLLMIQPLLPNFQDTNPNKIKSVLEISNSLIGSQQLTIDRAKLIKETASDALIEVVAIDKGINLLFTTTSHNQDIHFLMDRGVIFTVCQRSILYFEKTIGHRIKFLPGVHFVANGHHYAESLKENGYIDEFA